MRILGKDAGQGEVKVLPETDDDIWHLYNIIRTGDLVTASTVRRDEKSDDKLRAERAEKKRMTLGVRVEKIEYDGDGLRMRLLGVIEEGPQDIGQHHTLMIEPGEPLRIRKAHWKTTDMERLEKAAKDTVKRADENGCVIETPDRSSVWMIQTPQTFDYDLLRGAYEKLYAEMPEGITDDAMVVERYSSKKVQLVEGSWRNIKITTPEDMVFAKALL